MPSGLSAALTAAEPAATTGEKHGPAGHGELAGHGRPRSGRCWLDGFG